MATSNFIHTTLTLTINWGELDEFMQRILPSTHVYKFSQCAHTYGYIPTMTKKDFEAIASEVIWEKYGRRPVSFEWVAVRQHTARGGVPTKEETITSV